VPTALFGPLRVPNSAVLHFPEGLLGFAAQRRYLLLPAAATGVFWLQSCEESALAFVVVDPFVFFSGYQLEVPDSAPVVAQGAGEDLAVLSVVTLGAGPERRCSANLRAPLLINLRTRLGWQVVLPEASYSTAEPFDLAGFVGRGGSSPPRSGR